MHTANWTGSSGTKYPMQITRLGGSVPSYAGVYILCRRQDHIWSTYFVGEAEDIRNCLGESRHLGRDCAMRQGASYVATTVVDGGQDARMRVEEDIIKAYQPPCNG